MTAIPGFPDLSTLTTLRRRRFVILATLAGVMVGGPPRSRAEEIVPIGFADLVDQDGAADVLEIPSVLAAEEIVPGSERVVADRAAGHPLPPPSVAAGEPIAETSAQAMDGMRLDQLTLDEMPFQASSGDWFSNGHWYGSAEMIWFDRSRNYRRLLGYDATLPLTPGERLPTGSFTTTGIPFPLAPGGRITVGRYLGRDYLDRDRSLEMTYYGGLSFFQQDSYNAVPGSVLIAPLAIGVPGFTGAQTFTTRYQSIFNSLEWNYKLHRRLGRDQVVMSPNGEWSQHAERGWLPALLIGTRVTNVNETFNWLSSRDNVAPQTFSGNYLIDTQNWLWGMNFGGELISQSELYFWGLRGRATPSMSFNGNQQALFGVNADPAVPPPLFPQNSINRATSAQLLSPGFVGDLSLFAGWNVTPNFVLKAGYDFLWVAGIATATRQLDFNNVGANSHDGGGQIFYNGLSFGCEGSW
ncbi:hypothetical protein EBR56_06440 [bacterium]|nr:hypothetical protein [bacterium]